MVAEATAYSPIPMATPMAAAIQIVAAVVMPTTLPRSLRITPPPRKPTPVTICAATRPGSAFPAISIEVRVKSVEASVMRMIVRTPAAFSCNSRSKPMTPPSATARSILTSSSSIRRA